ncbi:MAG: HsdR family type I site-specific deoxyribonuclease [Prevotella sp.]|nr:HsdR family type I site-specific deoxyribonuclease [Prevotella sp.]
MGFDNEKDFEEALIIELTKHGWSDKIIMYPDEEILIDNWANILFNNNRGIDRLNDQPLTKGEMGQILEKIQDLGNPLALNGFINGKTVSITRDNKNDKLHFGKEVSLKIYDKHEIAGGKSTYQIARQPIFKSHNPISRDRRGDFCLLINGMPVIHVELKSSKVPARQAANQIEKYSHEGVFSGLFALVQIFVAMNPEETIYFANPGQRGQFNRDYYFHWADFNNEPINDWQKIASVFLSIPMAHQMIGYYTVADHAEGILKVLRSYQYYAANAISIRVKNNKWYQRNQLGGYIWHTTGSGKTMTSFKSAQLIANSGYAHKVVFLMDRIELGVQSLEEYRSFAEASEYVQATENTDVLVSKLKSDNIKDTLIVTSIQKMSRVNDEQKKRRAADIERIQDKHLVFIVDECHRSTFGEMMIAIKQMFPNALFFGFTGTPIQKENERRMNTTSTVFGDERHRYSIADGIRDKNVLGFDPYKVLTYKDRDLRKVIALDKAKAKTEQEALADEKKKKIYQQFMRPSVTPMAGYVKDGKYINGIEDFLPNSQYNDNPNHHGAVVKDIKDGWFTLSQDGKFHALLATHSISEAIQYYRLFKDEFKEINVTALFDPNVDNNDSEIFKEEGLAEIIGDYNVMFNQHFTISTHASFKKDISLRLSHKKPYGKIADKPKEQINILIVVDQMLTGFDSKWINTLYIDKVLEYENIIQAFSRTNRLFGPDKPFGTIKYYRRPHTMEQNIEKAVKLYSGDKPLGLFVNRLYHNLKRMNELFGEIKYIFDQAKIENFDRLPDDPADRGKFAKLFREFSEHLEAARIQGFRWTKKHYFLKNEQGKSTDIIVDLDEFDYKVLTSRYKELSYGGGGGVTTDLPYEVESYITERDTGIIDAYFMNSRFEKYHKVLEGGNVSEQERQAVLADLHKSYAFLTQKQQGFAEQFIHDYESGNVSLDIGKSFYDYVLEYEKNARNDQIHKISELFGMDEVGLRQLVYAHVTNNNINENNRFSNLLETVDKDMAKAYFEKREDVTISGLRLRAKIRDFIKDFILGDRKID